MEETAGAGIAVYKHRWVEVPGVENDLLLVRESDVPTRVHDPAGEDPLLFTKFADLKPEPGPILTFAEKYGDIGPAQRKKAFPDSPEGTSLSLWEDSISIISQLTDAWRKKDFDVRSQELLNVELRKHGGSCAPGIRRRKGKWMLWLMAYDTYGACLIQLVEAITEQTRVYRCEYCDKVGVRGPTEKRKRKYCSDTCRVKAYRVRKEDA